MHLHNAESNSGFSEGRDHSVTLLQCLSSLRCILKILPSGPGIRLQSLRLSFLKDTDNRIQS